MSLLWILITPSLLGIAFMGAIFIRECWIGGL
jgi:hypothetical protein